MSKGKHKRKRERAREHAQRKSSQPDLLPSEENHPEDNRNPPDCTDNQRQNKKALPMRLGERFKNSTVTDWLLTLFTGALVAVAIYQYIILSGQLNVMQKDTRAWISNIAPKATPSVDDPMLHIRTITVTNTGKTPAMKVISHLFVEVVPNGSQPHFSGGIPHTIYIVGVVLPNNPDELTIARQRFKTGYSGDTEDFPITADEITSLKEGRAWLAIYGRMEYQDIFKKPHFIQFCDWEHFKPGVWYSAQGCSEYNNVDGE